MATIARTAGRTSAQVEGWAQFFGATNLNISSDSNCIFVYYKEFYDGVNVQPVPNVKGCNSQIKWMENRCNASNRGVEFDLMNFYWRLRAKHSYVYANFASVYAQACGGSCSGASTSVQWSNLQAAANVVFGSTGAKALAWSGQGILYGVNH